MAGHTYQDNPLRSLPLQAEAYRGCMHCSGKASNRRKLFDAMGNMRHSPTPDLPKLVATSLVIELTGRLSAPLTSSFARFVVVHVAGLDVWLGCQ